MSSLFNLAVVDLLHRRRRRRRSTLRSQPPLPPVYPDSAGQPAAAAPGLPLHAACHYVALNSDGRCFSWGRNEKGQLGHGDTLLRNLPTIVSKLSKYNIIAAGVGRNHTYIANVPSVRLAYDPQPNPRAIVALSRKTVVKVACGTNHTVAVDSSGFVYMYVPSPPFV
ncbi:hypothetical protein ZWY2020_037621 [Hordeum vulgare]|nr:hypothetical protein ZWY2020_037621 [Hordeum vulgare]